jgi:two-component system sensor histidine kinase/response regulator
MTSQPTKSQIADILIVDDTPGNLRLLSQMLAEQGYKVRPVTSGKQALAAVQAMVPDLVLLDIRMPEMSGYEVCERLKASAQTCDIPIIFISALDEVQDKVQAFTVGGVDYITKPFQIEEVLARVKTHLALRDLQDLLRLVNQELASRLEELACANAELEARNEELDAFAHTVAHDLKGPVASLVTYGDMLQGGFIDMSEDSLQMFLDIILQGGHKMVNIINELLLLASVRKAEDARLEPLDMHSIVTEACTRQADLIEKHHSEIVLPKQWPVVLGRSSWIEEVWVNYISNAIKYGGQPPRLELGSDVEGEAVRFWVRDNGPGLTPEEQARLFTPFERLHQVRAEGHGLGLSIVRRIVEKLGGQVGVDSEGEGSTFWFRLAASQSSGSLDASGFIQYNSSGS